MTRTVTCMLVLMAIASIAGAIERFPPPQFTETGHQVPQGRHPPATAAWQTYLDVALLAAMMLVTTILVHRARNRRGVLLVSLVALLYFGFYREGCVCAVGSIQNVALSAGDNGYALPAMVAVVFLLPLVMSLFVGRVFCAGVCPLGVIQDLVLVRGVYIPKWLAAAVSLGAYVYLGLAVLAAATGSGFLICRYDPFVSIFRLSGQMWMLVLGACVLVLSTFIGRPYCRFLCPYGVLLSWCSRLSRRRVTITPDTCLQCKLCEDACPFGAIDPANADQPVPRRKNRTAMIVMIALLPMLVAAGTWGGRQLSPALARLNDRVRLSEEFQARIAGADVPISVEASAFTEAGHDPAKLHADALIIRRRFDLGGPILGAFLAIVVGVRLVNVFRRKTRSDYQANRASCLACGRCYAYCPRHRKPETPVRDVGTTE